MVIRAASSPLIACLAFMKVWTPLLLIEIPAPNETLSAAAPSSTAGCILALVRWWMRALHHLVDARPPPGGGCFFALGLTCYTAGGSSHQEKPAGAGKTAMMTSFSQPAPLGSLHQEVLQRWMLLWHGAFYVSLIVATGLAFT